jgi:hypothetical protein
MAKTPARSFPLPQAIPQETEEATMQQDPVMNPDPEASQEEFEQVEMVINEVNSFIYSDGNEDILKAMKDGEDALAQTIGDIGGNLLHNEIQMFEEEGQEISREVYIEMQSSVIHELTEVAVEEKLVKFKDDNEAQAFMGEALTSLNLTSFSSTATSVSSCITLDCISMYTSLDIS